MDLRIDRLMTELTGLLPPPPVVIEAPPWSDAPARVGFAFPADYRAFVDRYGAGWLTGEDPGLYLEFAMPVADSGDGQNREPFQEFVEDHTMPIACLAASVIPHIPFPEPGSLLWFGSSDAGDEFLWQVSDPDPDRWRVVVWSRHDGIVYPFDGGFVEFLIALLRDEFEPLHDIIRSHGHWTTGCDWSRYGLMVSASPAPAWSWIHRVQRDRV